MITVLKETYPIAKKEHTCMLCHGKIAKGQRYYRQTCVYDNVYDFIEHEECRKISHDLDMYSDCDDEGLNDNFFVDALDQHICDNYSEEESDRLFGLSTYERVCKVLNDLNKGSHGED